MNYQNLILRTITIVVIYVLTIMFFSCTSSIIDKKKKELLIVNKKWEDRTDFEKVIGCWKSISFLGTTGQSNRGGVKLDESLNSYLVFYLDSTIDFKQNFTVGLGGTDFRPLRWKLNKIENGSLEYKYDGLTHNEVIELYPDSIIYDNKTWYRSENGD